MARTGSRHMQRHEDFTGLYRRLVEILEVIVRRDAPKPGRAGNLHLRAHGQHHRGEFGRRIGQRHAAADRAAIADGGMGDEGRSGRQQRRMGADERLGQRFGVAGEGADAQALPLSPDAAHFGNRGEVDENLRRLKPHRQRRHEALAAGDIARVPIGPVEGGMRFGKG